jgi:hypothetical protein
MPILDNWMKKKSIHQMQLELEQQLKLLTAKFDFHTKKANEYQYKIKIAELRLDLVEDALSEKEYLIKFHKLKEGQEHNKKEER